MSQYHYYSFYDRLCSCFVHAMANLVKQPESFTGHTFNFHSIRNRTYFFPPRCFTVFEILSFFKCELYFNLFCSHPKPFILCQAPNSSGTTLLSPIDMLPLVLLIPCCIMKVFTPLLPQIYKIILATVYKCLRD